MSELEAALVLSAIWLALGLGLFGLGLVLATRSRHYFKRFLGLGLGFFGLAALAAARGAAAEPVVAMFVMIGGGLVMAGLASALRGFEAGKGLDPDSPPDIAKSASSVPPEPFAKDAE